MEVGEKIKAARIKKGLTQEELGKIVGVQKSAIAKYENGRVKNIKRKTLETLAKTLNLKGSDLIGEIENPEKAAQLTTRILYDYDLMELIEKYLLLSDGDKKTVRDLISSLAKK